MTANVPATDQKSDVEIVEKSGNISNEEKLLQFEKIGIVTKCSLSKAHSGFNS